MKLINTNKFYLKGTNNRFLHIASISHGIREFLCFQDQQTSKVYIEEISGGSLIFIDDDQLAFDIAKFLEDKSILDISKPTIPDNKWFKKG